MGTTEITKRRERNPSSGLRRSSRLAARGGGEDWATRTGAECCDAGALTPPSPVLRENLARRGELRRARSGGRQGLAGGRGRSVAGDERSIEDGTGLETTEEKSKVLHDGLCNGLEQRATIRTFLEGKGFRRQIPSQRRPLLAKSSNPIVRLYRDIAKVAWPLEKLTGAVFQRPPLISVVKRMVRI